MLSMLDHLVSQSSKRLIVLFYGVRNSKEHTFKDYFRQMSSQHDNVHVVNCYSEPLAEDQLNVDYQVQGFVSIDLIRQLLPDNRCQFYLCGPPPFMQSIRDGLLDWQVPENRIRFEAFGPASIKKASKPSDAADPKVTKDGPKSVVKFVETSSHCFWNCGFDSILELAEANDITLDSGCRAGSCGTCITKLLKGKVVYPDGVEPECGPGECLPCVAKPDGDIELDK
jgi:Na+-transporting NADH:ubiquinone oxidoreductase subunit NqrF